MNAKTDLDSGLCREGSGNARHRQCLCREGSGNTQGKGGALAAKAVETCRAKLVSYDQPVLKQLAVAAAPQAKALIIIIIIICGSVRAQGKAMPDLQHSARPSWNGWSPHGWSHTISGSALRQRWTFDSSGHPRGAVGHLVGEDVGRAMIRVRRCTQSQTNFLQSVRCGHLRLQPSQ